MCLVDYNSIYGLVSNVKILLIAEHGPKLGMGHLSRLYAIAEWLSISEHEILLFTNSYKSHLIEMFVKLNISINLYNHKSELIENSIGNFDFCIIDGDHLSEEIDLNLLKKNHCQVVRVSDQPKNYAHAKYLINQNLGSEKFGYRFISGQVQKFGLQQLMLREEVRLTNTKGKSNLGIKNVVISFGSSKSLKITHILQSLIKKFSEKEFSQLKCTFFVSELEMLNDVSRSDNIIILPLTNDFIRLTQQADFLITSVGTTVWEAMAMKVPFALIPLNEQQREYASVLSIYNICDILESKKITQEERDGVDLLQKVLSDGFCEVKKENIEQLLPKSYFLWLDEIMNMKV